MDNSLRVLPIRRRVQVEGDTMPNPLTAGAPSKKYGMFAGPIASLSQFAPRRTGHGGTLGPKPENVGSLRQPQDGAPISRAKLAAITSHLQANFFHEPEDARLTGGTRSLTRRLLGLNFGIRPRKTSPMVAGTVPQAKVA